jgi:hypothetical protein
MITKAESRRHWQRFLEVGLVLAVGLATLQGCTQTPPPPASNATDSQDGKPVVPKKAKLPKA